MWHASNSHPFQPDSTSLFGPLPRTRLWGHSRWFHCSWPLSMADPQDGIPRGTRIRRSSRGIGLARGSKPLRHTQCHRRMSHCRRVLGPLGSGWQRWLPAAGPSWRRCSEHSTVPRYTLLRKAPRPRHSQSPVANTTRVGGSWSRFPVLRRFQVVGSSLSHCRHRQHKAR